MIYNKFHLIILIIIILCMSFMFTKIALDDSDTEIEKFSNYNEPCTTNIGSCIYDEEINNVSFESKIINKKLENEYLNKQRNIFDYLKERDNIPEIPFDKDLIYDRICTNIKDDMLEKEEEETEENKVKQNLN